MASPLKLMRATEKILRLSDVLPEKKMIPKIKIITPQKSSMWLIENKFTV